MSRPKLTAKPSGMAAASRRPARSRDLVRLPRTDLPQRYLKAGDLMICHEPCVVTTVLGSCVAVTFFSARLKLAAICHAMLPAPRPGDAREEYWERRWKYVTCAVAELIHDFLQPSWTPSDVEVKIFGGAHLLSGAAGQGSRATVGSTNVELARRLLAEAGFHICAGDTGGVYGRKLIFDTRTGAVHVKRLPPNHAPPEPGA